MYRENSSILDDVWIADQFPWQKWKHWGAQNPEESNISHTGSSFLFSVREIQLNIEKWLLFDRSICILAFLKSFIWINILIYFENI